MSNDTAQSALVAQLQIPGSQSKKYRMVVIGLILVMVIFINSVVLLLLKPEVASQVTPLAQVACLAISGLIGIYCAGQSWVDSKTTSSLSVVAAQ